MPHTRFVRVNGHVDVYWDGEFLFSADTLEEAIRELKEDREEVYK